MVVEERNCCGFKCSFIYLFGCVRSQLHMGSSLRHVGSFVGARGLFVVVRGLLSSCGVWVFSSLVVAHGLQGVCALQFAAHRLQLRHASSVVVARRLSCPAACGIFVPRPGIEPASPALEGGFFITGPRGKSLKCSFEKHPLP